jgi:hypothetical protein
MVLLAAIERDGLGLGFRRSCDCLRVKVATGACNSRYAAAINIAGALQDQERLAAQAECGCYGHDVAHRR